MDCHNVSKKVNLLIDGEISGKEKEILLQHLELCRECYEIVEAREKLKIIIRERLQRKTIYEGLQKRVLDYVESNA